MRRRLSLAVALALAPGLLGAQARIEPRLEAALRQSPPSAAQVAWVFFRDKGAHEEEIATGTISARALTRRGRRGPALARLGREDAPIARAYADAVASRVQRVRHESRWFNALSVVASKAQLRAVAALPFVERLDLVRRLKLPRPEPLAEWDEAQARSRPGAARTGALDYGGSLDQLAQIDVPAVHELGLHGEGLVIAVFDAGFDNLAHEALATLQIVAHHDFVNGDDDVGDGLDRGHGSHGTATLSVLGGFMPGQLVGPAFGASFLLAKTEDSESETPIEEDNWAAAAEWAEALGADVVSTSLGYLTFDPGFASYTFSDMNGDTAISTLAAEKLAERGVVVVASAGNAGANPDHNTLGAPADGRHVIAVAAVTATGERAGFSSVGPSADGRIKPDVAARGVAVKVAGSLPGLYLSGSGTSFSCPLVAGVAALVLQAHPDYRVDDVLGVLRGTARGATNPDNLLGYGLVDALAAVTIAPPR